MYDRIFHSSPKVYGIVYLSTIPIFGFIYLLIPGVLCDASIFDNFYFSAVTITTLGYGDVLPQTDLGKFIAGFQAVFGVSIIGLFLNSLSEQRAKYLRDTTLEESRKLLETHICLLLEAAQSGNPFIWDKHAINSKQFSELEEFAKELYAGILKETYKLKPLQIKALLETAHQNYDMFVGLIPVASKIDASTGGHWISLVSNIRNLSDQYSNTVKNKNVNLNWPDQSDIALQVEEFIFVVCGLHIKPNKAN